jgi:hypothetical protein
MGFANDILGGAASLIRAAIKSPKLLSGSTGWSVNKDGSAEFNNVVIRGTIQAGHFIGTGEGQEFVIYSGTPAANNLIASITSAPAVDSFGNFILPQLASYGGTAGSYWALQQSITGSGPFIAAYSGVTMTAWTSGAVAAAAAAVSWDLTGNTLFLKPLSVTNPAIGSSSSQVDAQSDFVFEAGWFARAAHPGTTDTAETWQAMTLLNSWANVAGFATARYRLTPLNQVEVIGALSAAAATASTFFTLPAAYRPATQQPVAAAGASASVPAGLAPWIRVDTSGNLTVQNTGAVPAAWQIFFHGLISLDA